jgi:hypothetical protein
VGKDKVTLMEYAPVVKLAMTMMKSARDANEGK